MFRGVFFKILYKADYTNTMNNNTSVPILPNLKYKKIFIALFNLYIDLNVFFIIIVTSFEIKFNIIIFRFYSI